MIDIQSLENEVEEKMQTTLEFLEDTLHVFEQEEQMLTFLMV